MTLLLLPALLILLLLSITLRNRLRLGTVKNSLVTYNMLHDRGPIQTHVPKSVNFHFTRHCNYECSFCFHTQKTKDVLPIQDIKIGLKLLKEAGMQKINFAGGEPFLYPTLLGQMIQYCKQDLKVESVSIVSNASKIKSKWFETYGRYIDVLAVSVDSFNEDINKKIGRGNGNHLKNVYAAKEICAKYNILFKLNTVVNQLNWEEDMNPHIQKLNPKRWKVFKVLILKGENDGIDTKRDARNLVITDEQFESYLSHHKDQPSLVPENNNAMQNSYLVLDEKMRFLDSSTGGKEPSESILDVGVQRAMSKSGFDETKFVNRGGIYDWTKPNEGDGCSTGKTCGPVMDW